MAVHTFHGRIAAQAAQNSGELVTRSQMDAGDAAAKDLSNATGTLTTSFISDFTTAVNALIENVVGAAPEALDTLQELAAALGDDPDFAGTITAELGDLGSRITDLESAAGAGGYAETIGDGVESAFMITHNLDTVDVAVEVVRVADGQTVFPVVTRTDSDTVVVDFGADVPESDTYRVLVRKVA